MDKIPILTCGFAANDHGSHTYLENTSISRVKKRSNTFAHIQACEYMKVNIYIYAYTNTI